MPLVSFGKKRVENLRNDGVEYILSHDLMDSTVKICFGISDLQSLSSSVFLFSFFLCLQNSHYTDCIFGANKKHKYWILDSRCNESKLKFSKSLH